MFIGVQVGSFHSFSVFLLMGFALLLVSVFFFMSTFFVWICVIMAFTSLCDFFLFDNSLRPAAFNHNRTAPDFYQ
jgi:hypothetical protein